MSCYLNLSRRNELVVARAAGVSAWEFTAPAVIVALLARSCSRRWSTTRWQPTCRSAPSATRPRFSASANSGNRNPGFWVRQRSTDGQSIINARKSREQGLRLEGVTVFTFDQQGRYQDRIEARRRGAERWRMGTHATHASIRTMSRPASTRPTRSRPTCRASRCARISPRRKRCRSGNCRNISGSRRMPASPPPAIDCNTKSCCRARSCSHRWCFWRLPSACASPAWAASRKWFWAALLSGFLLYVLSKITEDMSKTELLSPVTAAWAPVLIGGLTGFLVLLYQEDG